MLWRGAFFVVNTPLGVFFLVGINAVLMDTLLYEIFRCWYRWPPVGRMFFIVGRKHHFEHRQRFKDAYCLFFNARARTILYFYISLYFIGDSLDAICQPPPPLPYKPSSGPTAGSRSLNQSPRIYDATVIDTRLTSHTRKTANASRISVRRFAL